MKIKFSLFILLLLINSSMIFSQVPINVDGSDLNKSATADLKSNNKGFLLPRMTHVGMVAIPNPVDGLIVYCTDCIRGGKGVMSIFIDGSWNSLTTNCLLPLAPTAKAHVPSSDGIVWEWNSVGDATGYKWNITDDYNTATQMDAVTRKTETGLACDTAYTRYIWAYNACGNSEPVALYQRTSVCSLPTISTTDTSAITATTATCGGYVASGGGAPITARGVCWGTTQNPTIANSKSTDGMGTGTFTSNLKGLSENTTYYLRAYATNRTGTGYGNEISFKTIAPISGTVTDIDGNVYDYITIGNQTWMVENLKTTKYRNGDPIHNVTDSAEWRGLATGAYCWYNNNSSASKTSYGALYNWYAVADGRNIAPLGWHVATDTEWTILTDTLGGANITGGKLKSIGKKHWFSPNTGATNESGFTALPGGYRFDGTFFNAGYHGYWWSSTAKDANNSMYRNLYYFKANIERYHYGKQLGFSVRCVRDR